MASNVYLRKGSVFVAGPIGGNAEIGVVHGSSPRTVVNGALACIERADLPDLRACLRVFAVQDADRQFIETFAREMRVEVTWQD